MTTAVPARQTPTRRTKNRMPWLFVAPSLLVLLSVTVFPMLYSLYLSFFQWEPTIPSRPFIGFGNYVALFSTNRFLHAVAITALIVGIGVTLELAIGFLFADFVMAERGSQRFIVSLMLLPVMIMPVVVGYTWRLLWDAQYGPINQMIGWILNRPFHFVWLGQTWSSIIAIIVSEVWQWTPFMFLVFYAGMATLDQEIFEAAEMDGANGWQQFWRISIPLMRPIIVVTVLIRALDAIKAFDLIYTLTGGAPGTSTETVSYFIYKAGYQFFRLGFGAAAAIILLLFLSVVLSLLLRALRQHMA